MLNLRRQISVQCPCCKTHQFLAVKVQFASPLPSFFFFFSHVLCKHLDVCLNLSDFVISTFAQKYVTQHPIG